MTLVEEIPSGSHVGELRLRRFRLGELAGADKEEITRHTSDCGPCRARLKTLEEEQRQFEREISFERFAGGVERARRVPRVMPRRAWTLGITGLAAAAALMLVLRPAADVGDVPGRNRIKGSTEATARIAKADGRDQRSSAPGYIEKLAPGELVRLGFRAEWPAHLVVVSVDDAGEVTALYPEGGDGLAVKPGADIRYLPDSIDFTGHGRERLFLVLSEKPLSVGEVTQAARAAHQSARGDLGALSSVKVEGHGRVEQFTWLFQKP